MIIKTLDLGSTGNEVRLLQENLMKLGYRIQKVTEEYDNNTKSAVKAFQNDNGIKVTGLVEQKTWDSIINMIPVMVNEEDSEQERKGTEGKTTKNSDEQTAAAETNMDNEKAAERDYAMKANETLPQSNISQAPVPEMPVISQFSVAGIPEVPKVNRDVIQNTDEDVKADTGEPWAWSNGLRKGKQMESEAYKVECACGKDNIEHTEMKTEVAGERELNSNAKGSDMIERKIRLKPIEFDLNSINGEKYKVVRTNNTQKATIEKKPHMEALEYETESVITKAPESITRKIDEKKVNDKITDEAESKAADTVPAITYIPTIRCDDEGCVGFAMIKKSKRATNNPVHSNKYTHRIDPAAPWEHTSIIIPSAARRYFNRTVTDEMEESLKTLDTEVYNEYSVEMENTGRGETATTIDSEENQKSDKKPKWNGEELRTIQWGSRNRTVNLLQRRLTELGYFKGDINGYFGFETRMAVIDFQLDRAIKADGIVNNETWNALYEVMSEGKAWPKLKMGDNGQDVVTLQKYLKEMVYYNGIADGYFGSMTHEAAVKFQMENNMSGDGVIDDGTWDAMENKLMSMSGVSAVE